MQDQPIKWYVSHAGIILVHPFLPHLFKVLGYLDTDETFKNEETQSRAVFLLYFVATGETSFYNEADLAIPKILCNRSIEQSIIENIVLNQEEKNTAIEMLTVVINRWEKLGATSIDGLRNTFLQRDGLLELKDNAYQLTVNSSGTDILLDFIPWTISTIQFPWTDKLMYISWR